MDERGNRENDFLNQRDQAAGYSQTPRQQRPKTGKFRNRRI